MPKPNQLEDLIAKIRSAYSGGKFENFIDYIRFPFYKNFEPDSKLLLSEPITILTGMNGTGKSSILHALYGAPKGKSIEEFWFSTSVDPIDRSDASCFIYGYRDKVKNEQLEVLKTRIGTAKGLDYWETSRPLKKYGMKLLRGGKRSLPLEKNVLYLDFRSLLSAYDKFFYFGKFKAGKKITSRQQYVRKYSKHLKTVLVDDIEKSVGKRRANKPSLLERKTLEAVCSILGKKYIDCKIIEHDLYGIEGQTVYFTTKGLNYSEAYAGRGEFAVVTLVDQILKAPPNSLVLLDEPEVSLHPGAQEKLRLFLLEQTLQRKLQIVISTHSTKLVEGLPDSFLKLVIESENGKFRILDSVSYLHAFSFLGQEIGQKEKCKIIVEDQLSRLLIEGVLREMAEHYPVVYEVEYYPGGADVILVKSVGYSEESEHYKYLVLDGDQLKNIPDVKLLTQEQATELDKLKNILVQEIGIEYGKLSFRQDSNEGDTVKCTRILKYLDFLHKNLQFLPTPNPENAISDKALISKYFPEHIDLRNGEINDKKFIESFAMQIYGSTKAQEILYAQRMLLKRFLEEKNETYKKIVEIIHAFELLRKTPQSPTKN
jgi:predicted ATPase